MTEPQLTRLLFLACKAALAEFMRKDGAVLGPPHTYPLAKLKWKLYMAIIAYENTRKP